jgi:cytochrome P450
MINSAQPRTAQLPPLGPTGSVLLGCMREFQRDPLGLYRRANRTYGHFVRIRAFPGVYVYLLTHPEAIEHVLQKNHKNYRKPDFFNKPIRQLTGNGLFASEGDFWLRQRRLMQPAFHRASLAQMAPVMADAAHAFVEVQLARPADQAVDLLDEMMMLTLRIAGKTLLSTDVTAEAAEIGNAFRLGFAYLNRRMNSPPLVPTWVPTPANLAFRRAKRVLDQFMLRTIAARRALRRGSEPEPHDFLSLLIAAQDDETGAAMNDRQISDEALTLLMAGHETVGAALAWVWYLLGSHPEIQEQAADEVRGRLQGRRPTVEDLPHLPLVRAIFDETLRLYPPAWAQPRESIGADEINGFLIPARSPITLSQYVTHRHPDFWEEPDCFKPERFLPGQPERRYKFAYFPFGGGPRVCIGNTFTLMEGPLLLATILQRLRVDLVPGQAIVGDTTFTLRPKHHVKAMLRPR